MVGAVAYKLELPQELSRVHNMFHVSNLKKCYSDDPLVVPLEGLQVDDKLHFVEEPVEIMDREVKQLRRSRVPIVKVRWNSRRGPEFTWEREDQFRKKYPHLFTKTAPSLSAVSIRVALDEEQLFFIAGGLDNDIDEDVDEQPVQDLALNVDNVFQADDCDAFDSDVDEAPTAQTMFMANLSSAYPVYDEAGPSYDSDILSKVYNHDHYQDAVCEHLEEHEMHDDYVKDNAMPVVQSNVSYVPNDAYMMIFNDMHELHAQSVFVITQNTVVDNSLTAKLATYKEQVKLYERWATFKLTEREQKIDEQLRIVITDRNIKEENLKKELHSSENRYTLEEFLDMKALKEKVEDKLYKQDQSLQTVHMLCKPKPYYDEQRKVAIGYKNLLCLTRAKQVQPALYNGHEIIKTHHVPTIVHNSEDTLEIAEITRKKKNAKMKTPLWTEQNINIRLTTLLIGMMMMMMRIGRRRGMRRMRRAPTPSDS
ncbi:hypothetical protein Tco_1406579 [Tanacetum coccineum]